MIDNADDLRDKANEFKVGLKKQYVNIPIGDEEYGFRISGIGAKSVKLENTSNLMISLKPLNQAMTTVSKL